MRKLLLIASAAAMSLSSFAATRLTFDIKGEPVPIAWDVSAFPIAFKIDAAAAKKLPGGAEAVARSFEPWQSSTDSAVSFTNAGVSSTTGGQDHVNSIGINDQLFENSGFLAFTTTWFDESGRISEADIQIDPTVATDPGRVQALVEHEVGHLLGLDHSGVVSSTMYPFVTGNVLTGLDSDDRNALATLYPATSKAAAGRMRGRVTNDGGAVFAAQVVAVDGNGTPVTSTLTNRSGEFELEVPAGEYKLYVEPLDGPVEPRNLSGIWRTALSRSVRTSFLRDDQFLRVESGQVHEGLSINAGGATALNARWIGTFAPGSRDVSLASTPSAIRAGQTVSIAIGGDGFVSGLTEFEVLRQGVTRVSDFQYGPNYVWATFRIAPDATTGPVVIRAISGTESAMLTGALRVLPSVEQGMPPGGRKRPVSGK